MKPDPHKDEVRPTATLDPEPVETPLLSLRGERRVIAPDACRLGDRCLVCRWRRAGLLDVIDDRRPPRTEAA